MPFFRARFVQLFFLCIVVLLFAGVGCKNNPDSKEALERGVPVTLEYWGVWNDAGQMKPLVDAYRAIQPNVKIVYRKFRFEEFESKLTEALAEDRGPDLISIQNTWMRRYQSNLLPMPKTPLRMPRGKTEKKGVATETTYTITSVPVLSPRAIKDHFVPPVYTDVVIGNEIYGLPLSV